MPPIILDRTMRDPNASSPTNFDNAQTLFQNSLLLGFWSAPSAWDIISKLNFAGEKTQDFMAYGEAIADSHTPGAEITGQILDKKNVLVTLEDEETKSVSFMTNIDKLVTRADYTVQAGVRHGRAMLKLCDSHTLRQGVIAATTAATNTFAGGQQLASAVTGATIAAAFPMSLAGSRKLQTAIGEIVQGMHDDDVPDEEEKFVFLSNYLHRVLRQDNTLLSEDYVGGTSLSDKLTGKLLKVEDCWIIRTNNMPTADLSGGTTPIILGSAAYAVDCSKVAAIVMSRDALGAGVAGPIESGIFWDETRRIYRVGGFMLKGIATLEPRLSGVIKIAG